MHLPVMKPFYSLFLFAACLLTSEGANMKIAKGHEARVNSRPYMALIIDTETAELYCGGSLINAHWVVTAASCELPVNRAMVVLGAHLSDISAQEDGRQTFDVEQQIIHPKYNKKTFDNDIMLMKLSRGATLGQKVGLLSLPKTYEDVKAGTVCETAGWGWTEKNKIADVLMEVEVPTISRKECYEHGYVKKGDKGKMCTAEGFRGEDSCNGDLGDPLICGGVFRGISSYGIESCGMPDGVAVYTRLTEEYVDWIYETTAHDHEQEYIASSEDENPLTDDYAFNSSITNKIALLALLSAIFCSML